MDLREEKSDILNVSQAMSEFINDDGPVGDNFATKPKRPISHVRASKKIKTIKDQKNKTTEISHESKQMNELSHLSDNKSEVKTPKEKSEKSEIQKNVKIK